jgi:signal transduction histidine kinase
VEGSSPVAPEDLMMRPEIGSALEGNPTSSIRRVPAMGGRRVLYAAAPVYAIDGSIAGIVYLATPLPAAGLPINLALQFLAVFLLAVSLASLAGRGLARQIARPLQELASSAEVLASGELAHRTSLQSRITELERLGQSFNSMAENLSRSDLSQKAFIADVTHELRTPLTVIKGTIETLEDGAMDDMRGRIPLLDSMHRETDRLIRLVNDLLVLVRADAGELRMHLQPVTLGALVQARCKTMRLLADRGQVELRVLDETSGGTTLHADSDRLSQVVDNLLDNAIRHAPPRTTVTILIREQQAGVTCTVRDQGPGIPEEHLARVFDRFFRVDDARDRGHGGMGLGLAIARAIVQAHGGRIWAEGYPCGGAVLAFWLPAGTPDPDSTQF